MSASPDNLGNTLVKRIPKRDMSDNALFKKGERANPLGPINHLVRDDKVSRLDLFLQTAHRRESDDCADADGAEGGDVCACGHLVRRDLVVLSMAAEESDGDGFVLVGVVKDSDRGGGRAPGRLDVERGDLVEAGEFAQAGATDDGDGDGVYGQYGQYTKEMARMEDEPA